MRTEPLVVRDAKYVDFTDTDYDCDVVLRQAAAWVKANKVLVQDVSYSTSIMGEVLRVYYYIV